LLDPVFVSVLDPVFCPLFVIEWADKLVCTGDRFMMTLALVLFVCAALLGATLVFCHFRFRTLPMAVVLGHGSAAAVGLVLLVIVFFRDGGGPLRLALVVLVIAALGGFANLALNMRRAGLHLPFVALHAVLAATGLTLLVLAWWN
jgi:hypothetical protein